MADLARAGVDLSHGHGRTGISFTTELDQNELDFLDQQGIKYNIDIADLTTHRHDTHNNHGRQLLECHGGDINNVVPENFELGNSGGFFSMSEVLDNLDLMSYFYPNLISVGKPIGTIKTWKNNSIFWIKISDNPEVDENEPEILYTGLTHARELISVSQNIYFMWYLLENYEKDPVIKQIIDNTELYFIPVINPDGLNYNIDGYSVQQDSFTRAWRKNLCDNDLDGVFNPKYDGVDLNRNFGYEWGYDDMGSSPNPGASTYRGASPFSEPETRAVQTFCNSHHFKIALNYHSYGNWLIYPWGYDALHTTDSTVFEHYAELLTQQNRFVYGFGSETVGYNSNGDSDDWMYGALDIFSLTPEVGDEDVDGFYPPAERIIPLCQSTLKMNLLAARLVNSLISITDESSQYIKGGINEFNLEFNRYGLLNGNVTISFNPLSPSILQAPDAFTIDLQKFVPYQRKMSLTIDPQVAYGTELKIEVVCQQGQYTYRDTITKIRADFVVLVDDPGELIHWDKEVETKWDTTSTAFKSPPVSITDSPDGLYGPDVNEAIWLNNEIDLRDKTSASIQFWARWDIEDYYDYVVFQASRDGVNWDNLCGERSKLGSIFQLYEEPLYDDHQYQWVLETTDLSDYIGEQIQLRFLFVSDGFGFRDGFYFDDFKVTTIKLEETTSTDHYEASAFSVFPNPSENTFMIRLPELKNASVDVYDMLGNKIYHREKQNGTSQQIDATGWPAGVYQYVITSEGNRMHSGKLSLIH